MCALELLQRCPEEHRSDRTKRQLPQTLGTGMYLSYGHMNLTPTFISANGSPPAETQFEVPTWTCVH